MKNQVSLYRRGLFFLFSGMVVFPALAQTQQEVPLIKSTRTSTYMVIKAAHLPRPGETILGGTFFMNPGGKGANQAVAIARLGGSVTFICKTGSDIFGHQSQQLFEEEGINTSYVFQILGILPA